MQRCVDAAVEKVRGTKDLGKGLSVGLVDLSASRLTVPVAAFRNEEKSMYGASVSKLGALIAAHQLRKDAAEIARDLGAKDPKASPVAVVAAIAKHWGRGEPGTSLSELLAVSGKGKSLAVDFTPGFKKTLAKMARDSNNPASSTTIHALGFPQIGSVLWQHGLYDPDHGGGLWVGRGFGSPTRTWQRDPRSGLSHGANVASLVTAFVRLAQGTLVDEEASKSMKTYMSDTVWNLKLVRGLRRAGFAVNGKLDDMKAGIERVPADKRATVWRKSGSMDGFSHDVILLERAKLRYVASVMADRWSTVTMLMPLAPELDRCIALAQR